SFPGLRPDQLRLHLVIRASSSYRAAQQRAPLPVSPCGPGACDASPWRCQPAATHSLSASQALRPAAASAVARLGRGGGVRLEALKGLGFRVALTTPSFHVASRPIPAPVRSATSLCRGPSLRQEFGPRGAGARGARPRPHRVTAHPASLCCAPP